MEERKIVDIMAHTIFDYHQLLKIKSILVIIYFWSTKSIYSRVRKILFLSNLSMDCFIFNISFQREIFWNIFRDCSVCFDWVKVLVIKVDTHQNSCPLFIFVNEAGSSGNVIFSLHKQISLLISLWVTKSGENQNTTMIVLF